MTKKLFFLQDLNPVSKKIIVNHCSTLYELQSRESISFNATKDDSIFLGSSVSDDILSSLPNGFTLQLLGSGIDKLNVTLLRQKQASVYASYSHSPYVAEHACALLLSLVKQVCYHHEKMKLGNNSRIHDTFTYSPTLIGKKLGFLGFGHIAQNIALLLSGFSNKIYAFNRSQSFFVDHPQPVIYNTLDFVLSESDIIFICLPLTSQTRGLLNADSLSKCKPSSLIVNISRGNIFVEKDIYTLLLNHQISGLAMDNWFDVYKSFDGSLYRPFNYPFDTLDNVIFSPYRAMYLGNLCPNLIDVTYNLTSFYQNAKLKNKIDLGKEF